MAFTWGLQDAYDTTTSVTGLRVVAHACHIASAYGLSDLLADYGPVRGLRVSRRHPAGSSTQSKRVTYPFADLTPPVPYLPPTPFNAP